MSRDKQQQIDQLKRDAQQHGFTLQRDDRQFGQQMKRDATQQGYQVQNDDRNFGQQLQRDAIQQDYGVQNDERQFGQQVQRDVMQDTFTNRRDENQQRNLLQRDQQQFGYQSARDQQQNAYQGQRDERLQGYSEQDAKRAFGYQQQRDERLQGYDTQNATQRETADIRSKWMDQVQQQRNNGFDFSPKQQKEMQQMEETFLRQVLNNPELDEGLKQDAMRQYQMKLAGFIPNEKVRVPQQTFEQSIVRDPETGEKFLTIRDPQGFERFEPIGSGGAGQQQKEDPQIKLQRDAMFKREDEFLKIRDKIASKSDPETGEPLYSDEEIDKLAMDEFAPKEAHYRKLYELPPQAKYQKEADIERQKMEQKRQRNPQRPSQYDVNRPAPPMQPQPAPQMQPDAVRAQQELQQNLETMRKPTSPPAKTKPVAVSSTNIDDQLKTTMDSGDQESATALQFIKVLTDKHGGFPPQGTQDFADLLDAVQLLESRGIAIDGKKAPAKPNKFEAPRRGVW